MTARAVAARALAGFLRIAVCPQRRLYSMCHFAHLGHFTQAGIFTHLHRSSHQGPIVARSLLNTRAMLTEATLARSAGTPHGMAFHLAAGVPDSGAVDAAGSSTESIRIEAEAAMRQSLSIFFAN